MRGKPESLGPLFLLLMGQLCFDLFIDCASRYSFIRKKEILTLKTIEGLEIIDPLQLPCQHSHVITDEERGPQRFGSHLTESTQERVTLDPGLPRARSVYHADQ